MREGASRPPALTDGRRLSLRQCRLYHGRGIPSTVAVWVVSYSTAMTSSTFSNDFTRIRIVIALIADTKPKTMRERLVSPIPG